MSELSNVNRHVEVLQLLVALLEDVPDGHIARDAVHAGRWMEVCREGDRYRGFIHNEAAGTYEPIPREVLSVAGYCRMGLGYEGSSEEFGPWLYFSDFTA